MDILILGKHAGIALEPQNNGKIKVKSYYANVNKNENSTNYTMVLSAYRKITNILNRQLIKYKEYDNVIIGNVKESGSTHDDVYHKLFEDGRESIPITIGSKDTGFKAYVKNEENAVVYSLDSDKTITIQEIINFLGSTNEIENVYVFTYSKFSNTHKCIKGNNWGVDDIKKNA